MLFSIFPIGTFAVKSEELYAQMLALGLVDGDGALIEDNTFTVEDGTHLSSLDELVTWLNRCGEDDLNTLITVDANGRSATAEQFMYALSIEYQMADLAQTLNLLSSASGDASLLSSGSSVDTSIHDLSLWMDRRTFSFDAQNGILTLDVRLYNGGLASAPYDIPIQVGMFADFLPPYDQDVDTFAADGTTNVPGCNHFNDFTIPKGSNSITFKLDLNKLRSNYLSQYEKRWDGYADILFQVRTKPYDGSKIPACTQNCLLKIAPSQDTDPIVDKITGGILIGKRNGNSVQPYHLNWQQHDSATEKVTIDGTEYFKINTAVPAAKGYTYDPNSIYNETHGWMDAFNRALKQGVGDKDDPKVNLNNVTLWSKEDNAIKVPLLYIKKENDLVRIANRASGYEWNDFSSSESAAYLADLARVQEEDWDYNDPSKLNFYKKVKSHDWHVWRFTDVEVPITPMPSSNYVVYPQDWYLPVDWITQNNDNDLRPEEILMHGSLTLVDKTAPTVESIETCARSPKNTVSTSYNYSYFYPGNVVPIVVTFSEPVYGEYALAYLDGTETKYLKKADFFTVNAQDVLPYSEKENGNGPLSKTRVFYYRVQDTDSTGIQILGVKPLDEAACTDVYGNKFKAKTDGDYKEFKKSVLDGYIYGGKLEDSILSMSAAVDTQDPGKVSFKVNLNNDETFQTKWLEWSKSSNAQKVTAVLDGDTSKSAELELDVEGTGAQQEYILTGTMTLPNVNAETQHTVELYFGNSRYYGAYAAFTQQPVTLADESAYTISVGAEGWPSEIDNVVFLQDAQVPVIEFTDNSKSYTYNYLGTDDVKWTVSDPDILQLTAFEGGGTDLSLTQTVKAGIVPLKAGTSTISLECSNNGKETTTASNSITITVKDSGRPSIKFPSGADTIYARIGSDQTIHFASNLSAHGPADGKITAKLYKGSSVAENAEPVWETILERTAANLTIPGDQFTAISQGDTPSYILRLTASANVENTVQDLMTEAKVIVRSQPAMITLTGLENSMVVSGQPVSIGWTVENFDLTANPEECQFQFTVEKDGETVYTTSEKAVSGKYTLIPDMPEKLKDYYIVTAKAKNGADPTWSIASGSITVYRNGALNILVSDKKKDSVTLKNEITGETTAEPSIKTYAGKTIDGLTSAQAIAGLRSELSLIESISIDDEEHSWNILYDTIQWKTSTGQGDEISDELQRVVSINYREGSLYAPLEQYSYTSYLPQTILLLCGLRNGSNTITAAHSGLPALSDSVTVNVETLKDKLYLFQFTPSAKTEISYKDGQGKTHTVYSNNDGSLALFEPNGIASDLRAAAVSNGVSYRGTISQLVIKSGEGSGVRGELYPLNTIELRRAATAQVQLLRPDGTPLADTDVTLRGGVYRNRYAAENRDDAYCADAKFAKAAGQAASLDGMKDQTFTTDANGMLTVHMDLSQFTSKNDTKAVGVGDSLEFIFELRFGDTYYPEIVTIDGSLTQRDAMRSGENIVTLTAANKQKPVVAVQTVSYTGREIDVRKHTGVIGPSSNYPKAVLESSILLWGIENVSFDDTKYRFDLRAQETGVFVPNQKSVTIKDATYPFSSIPIVSNSVTITSDSFRNYDGTRKTPLEAALYSSDGKLICTISLPFGLADLTTIERVEDAPSVMSLMANLAAYGTVGGADTEYEYANKVSDGIMIDALSFMEKMGGETGLVKAILMPTEDPTRYEAYLWTGINTTKLEDLDYDRNGISLEPSYIGQDYDSLLGQVNDTFTLSDFQAMADGSYFDDRSNLYGAVSGAIGLPIMLQLEGWVSTEIRYSFDDGQWKVLTTGGGFTAGAQLEFEKVLRCSAYGIPLTASFKVRGGATVDFQTAIRYAEQLGLEWNEDTANAVNDYLTALRINAYFEFFGGLGYDQGFTAKIGVFGTIEINNENRFLTRKYLKNPEARDVRGQFLQLDGEAGIRTALGVGPLVTEITLVSLGYGTAWKFNEWDDITDYWESASSGLGSTGWTDDDLASQNLMMYGDQSAVVATEPVVSLQSRDYLKDKERTWSDGESGISLMSLDKPSGLQEIETNSYPFSEPMLSDDGDILVYLSDADSTDVTDVEVRYSLSKGGSFPNGTAIPDGTDGFSGYGDSSLNFDGTSEFSGAVWLREAATLNLKAGTELNEGQQTILLNGLEVMASIWDGNEWNTTRLTENGSQELEPVIAVNNGKAIAAWRSVQTGESAFDFTQNRILYKIFDGTEWSNETYTLYNGNAGDVTGMSAEILENGTASVAFSVEDGNSGSDIYYAVVDTSAADPEDDAKIICATTSSCIDKNPQLIAVGDEFVLGWSSIQSLAGAEQYDIGLRVFDETGAPKSILPESLRNMVSATAFDGQFTFVKGADSLDELSVLWNDAQAGNNENDVIRSIKFKLYDSSYISSAPIEVAELPERTVLDHMDARVTNVDGTGIQAVLQGTTYSDTKFENVEYTYELDGKTHFGTGRIPEETVNLFSAAETYTDAVEVVATTVDYTTLTTDSYVPVNFTVANRGMNIIDSITIQLDGAGKQKFTGFTLLPGQSKTFSVVTKTDNKIEDLNYKVKAAFHGTGERSVDGIVYLDYPDVGISALTVTSEQNGLRSVLAHLYNQSAASLNKSDRRVVIGAYSDPECSVPINGKYFTGGIADKGFELIIDGDALNSIDDAGYTKEMTFKIGEYISDAGLKEIPDSGVMIFIKARIERQVENEWIVVPEADSQNNQKNITFDSLLSRSENMPAAISVEMENGSTTTANVRMRNNSLQPRTSGNLVAALLDQNGTLLETKNIGNLTLTAEEVKEESIAFSKSGTQVVLRYGETVSDNNTADAASINISGLPLTIDSFDEKDSATVENVSAGQYLITVIPEGSGAAITVNGEAAENGTATISGGSYKRTVTVTITSADGLTKRTYTIYLNPDPSQSSGSGYDSYTLTFETNSGSQIKSLRNDSGTIVDLAAYTPVRNGYIFTGWYTDKALTEKITKVELSSSKTIYAGWKEAEESPFIDVLPDNYYYDAVMWAVKNKVTNGTSDTTFGSEGICTRAQAVTFLWRAVGSPEPETDSMPFTDVETGSYYYDAVLWAVENDITKGTSDTEFSPDETCSRAQIMTFLWRSQENPAAGDVNPFTDVKADAYYAEAVMWAVKENVTKGTTDTTFSPDSDCTRAQIVTFIWRSQADQDV